MNDLKGLEIDELLTMMEDLQDEVETLQNQQSEAQQKISRLSSENSLLKSELQKKSGIIVSLNERIEKLSGSDLVLKQNDRLRKQNEELRQNAENTRREAETTISVFKEQADREVKTVKAEYEQREADLVNRGLAAARREKKVTEREKNIQKEIIEYGTPIPDEYKSDVLRVLE